MLKKNYYIFKPLATAEVYHVQNPQKMIIKPGLKTATALFSAFIFLTACQKQLSDTTLTVTPAEAELSQAVSEDDAESEVAFNEVYENVLGNETAGIGDMEPDGGDPPPDPTQRCYTVTVVPRDPGVFPKTITIDFGAGCLGRDGKTRKGKIITVYTNPLVKPGAEAVTTFDGHFVNDTKVEGRHTTKNNSTSAVRIFTRTVIDGKLSKPNGNYIKWNATHTNTQVAGLGTPAFPRDDEFNITGAARGENKRDDKINTWSRLILEPLHKRFTCRWFDKGVVKITRNNIPSLLNYGNGTCDNDATVTINGTTKNIKLK